MTKKPKSIDEIQWDNIGMHHILLKLKGERDRLNRTFDYMEAAVKHMHATTNGYDHDRDLVDGFVREWDLHRYQSRVQPLSVLLLDTKAPAWKEKLGELNNMLHGKPLNIVTFQRRVRHYLENLSPKLTQPEVGQEQLKEND